jgi:hypothetical protein
MEFSHPTPGIPFFLLILPAIWIVEPLTDNPMRDLYLRRKNDDMIRRILKEAAEVDLKSAVLRRIIYRHYASIHQL